MQIENDMSQPLGKTIQIFLPDGNPRGVKIAEFTSRTVQCLLVPRAQLEFACSRPETGNVGVYFLIGEAGAGSKPSLYLGETEDCAVRLKQHNKNKDWWAAAIICVAKAFTKTHGKYLEWYCHEEAKAADRYKLENGSIPNKPFVSEPMEADLMDYFETVRILTSTLGFPLFDKIVKPKTKDILLCKGKKAAAKGEYTDDGLVVFAGSLSNRHETSGMHKFMVAIRQELQENGILEVVDNDTLRFTKDHIFPSPSQAAAIVLARNANGWLEWKYSNGLTLDEVKRKIGNPQV